MKSTTLISCQHTFCLSGVRPVRMYGKQKHLDWRMSDRLNYLKPVLIVPLISFYAILIPYPDLILLSVQADWSTFIAPFWKAVFMSALKPKNFLRMLQSGFTTVKGFIATVSTRCVRYN